jgi:hypothetical protein
LVETRGFDPAELASSFRSAIDDMRLVIDSIDPTVEDIAMSLGHLRGRIEPQLVDLGIRCPTATVSSFWFGVQNTLRKIDSIQAR